MPRIKLCSELIVATLLLSTWPVGSAEPILQPTLLEVSPPKSVKITHPGKIIATPLSGLCKSQLPEFLVDSIAFTRQSGKHPADVAHGRIDIEVTDDGPIVIAACYQYDGKISGDLASEKWTEEKFSTTGWKFVADLSLFDSTVVEPAMHKLYIRQCRSGEKFTVRSRKYRPPIVIVPATQRLTAIANIDGTNKATAGPVTPVKPTSTQTLEPPAKVASRTPVVSPAPETAAPSSLTYLHIGDARNVLGGRMELQLPRPFEHLATGAGGRLLFCHLKDDLKLIVVDLEKCRVEREINLPGPDAMVAAGRDKFFVLSPGQKLLQRWNIATFEREKTVSLSGDKMPKLMQLGSNSTGPLLFWRGNDPNRAGPIALWDLEELQPLRVTGEILAGLNYQVAASADGKTFVGWTTGLSAQGHSVMRVSGLKVQSIHGSGGRATRENWCIPAADGSYFCSPLEKVLGFDLRPANVEWMKSENFIPFPSDDPRLILTVRRREGSKKTGIPTTSDVIICSAADRIPICRLDGIESVVEDTGRGNSGGQWELQPRVRYLPGAMRLVLIPESNDRIVSYRFDLADSLNTGRKTYLFTVSKPPVQAPAGGTLRYQVESLSSGGALSYRLESAPDGAKISATGMVEWTVQRPAGDVTQFVISVTNAAGHEAIHSFDLTIGDGP